MDRRQFCVVMASAAAMRAANADEIGVDIATIDRARILAAAKLYLEEEPVTITSFTSERNPGGLHDYFSEGDYWWPDPAHPNGPYLRKDGFTNPDNFDDHRKAVIGLSLQVPALVAAWMVSRDMRYADHAAGHVRAWFVDPATRMNPNLEHAQAISGVNQGRGIGIIDTVHLVEVARAISVLLRSGALGRDDRAATMGWFHDYLTWMTTSAKGMEERDAKNNHGSCWLLQVAEFARLTGNEALLQDGRERFRTVIVPDQIAPDGSLPLELVRTKPYSYALFDLDILTTIAQVLSTPTDCLWKFTLADGRGLRKAIAFMEPFIRDKSKWPYPHDVEHFDELPVRQVSLLFAGIAYRQPGYIALWKTLDPDPASKEIVRNMPIRQPVLWSA